MCQERTAIDPHVPGEIPVGAWKWTAEGFFQFIDKPVWVSFDSVSIAGRESLKKH